MKGFLCPSSPEPANRVYNFHSGGTNHVFADGSVNFIPASMSFRVFAKLNNLSENDGAPEGKYQVLLIWHDEESKEEAKPDRFLGWYGGVHSKLTFIVKAGENIIPPIQVPLISRPPEQLPGIPGKN